MVVTPDSICLESSSGKSTQCYFGWTNVSGTIINDPEFKKAELHGETVNRLIKGAIKVELFSKKREVSAVFAFANAPHDNSLKFLFPNAEPVSMNIKRNLLSAQKKLKELGYDPGKPDGIWGRKTEAAIKRYQEESDLPVTGSLDSETEKKMGLN